MHVLQEKLIAVVSVSKQEWELRQCHGSVGLMHAQQKTCVSCYMMRLPAWPSRAWSVIKYPRMSLHSCKYKAKEHVMEAGSPPTSLSALWGFPSSGS